MFASSSFYGPNHPTMEEQVELARRISSSLSDISNKESKGQSMYVNRKKRSVKWVHQGGQQSLSEFSEHSHAENLPPTPKISDKPVLKLVMNPRGQVQDFNSLKGQAFDSTPSPEVCFDLVKDLNSPCGKGAELFAKRRKKAEKWVVDESNVKTSSETTSMSSYESSFSSHTTSQTTQMGKMATPTFPTNMASLPTPTYMKDVPQRFAPSASKNQIPEKYIQPKVRMIKSPWEAALEGSVDSAFLETVSAASPTPRGHVLVAPSPSSFSKMVAPSPPQPQAPSSDLYLSRPPKAWHQQPTGKQFSSVKLEQIFAGSAKSPVSLAYHADTNTISSEPVPVETVPPIAVKLYDYEIIDPSILREPKTRRPDQILADVEPMKIDTLPGNRKWPPTEEEHESVGAVIWSATTAHWAKSQPGVNWTPEPPQQTQSPSQQKVQWPPQEDAALDVTQLPPEIPHLPQSVPAPQLVSSISLPKESPQQIPTLQKPAVFIPSQTQPTQQQVTWTPKMSVQTSAQSQDPQQQSLQSSLQSSLQQSLSEIQSAMSQTCQNFTKVESSEIVKSESVKSSHQEISLSQESQSTIEENKQFESKSTLSTTEEVQQSNSVSISEQISTAGSVAMNESSTLGVYGHINGDSSQVALQPTQTSETILQSEKEDTLKTVANENVAVIEPSSVKTTESYKFEEGITQSEKILQESITQSGASESAVSVSERKESQNGLSTDFTSVIANDHLISGAQLTASENGFQQGSTPIAINGFNSISESSQSVMGITKAEEILQSSQFSSSSEQQTMMHTSKTASVVEQKQIQESMTSSSKVSEFYESNMNGVKSGGFSSVDGLSGFSESRSLGKNEKSEYKSSQESQYAESAMSRLSMSVMSTTDEEVQDLCEREFNQISMQYEKVDKPDIRKPAAIIPGGGVKIFPTGSDFSTVAKFDSKTSTQSNQIGAGKESVKKPYKKPASMVPGARPLFGEAIELNFGFAEGVEGDRPYEKIPVKNLIKSFEESTRPFMKSNTKEQVTNEASEQLSSLQQQSVSEQSAFTTSLYETFPSDNIPSFQGGDIKSPQPAVNKDWSQIEITPSAQSTASMPSSIHVDLSNVNNFNTAPRGWKSNVSIYKPVTFSTAPATQISEF